jgi:hypothetical protein
LYKYGFNREINAAEQRQRTNGHVSGRDIERRSFRDQAHGLSHELEKERERNRALVARSAIMEANAARLGFDPEEIYKPILKPVRTTSRAGQRGANGLHKRSGKIPL